VKNNTVRQRLRADPSIPGDQLEMFFILVKDMGAAPRAEHRRSPVDRVGIQCFQRSTQGPSVSNRKSAGGARGCSRSFDGAPRLEQLQGSLKLELQGSLKLELQGSLKLELQGSLKPRRRRA
jgi:hypothetical protein